MKILSAEIKNFRIHAGDRPLKVTFDERLHVIHGPNEAGKSTVMDAIAACLFQKCTLTGNSHRSMQPDDGSKPEIQVVFESGGKHYEVRKCFKGQSGTCELVISEDGRIEATMNGSEAEDRLNEVLSLSAAGRGDRKGEQMAHWRLLWVNQGASKQEPTLEINEDTRNDLQGILAAETDGAVLSPDEAAWIADLERSVNACFTPTGKPRAGSRAVVLEEKVEDLESELSTVQKQVSAVKDESDRYIENDLRLKEIDKQLPDMREKLRRQHERKLESDKRTQKVNEVSAELRRVESDLRAMEGALGELGRLAKAIREREGKLSTLAEKIEELDQESARCQEKRDGLVDRCEEADDAYAAARRLSLRSRAHAALLRARGELGSRQAALDKAEKIDCEIRTLRKRIALLPVQGKNLEEFGELDRKLSSLRAALEAASARISIAAKESVTLMQGDVGETLPPNELHGRQLDQETRITIGDEAASIVIVPGGEDLRVRRERVSDAERDLRNRLMEFGVESIDAAKAKLCERQSLERSLHSAEDRLSDLDEDGVGALQGRRDAASRAVESSEAALGRYSRPDDPDLPAALDAAEQDAWGREEAEAAAQESRELARGSLQELEGRLASIKTERSVKAEEAKCLDGQNRDDQIRLGALIEEYGDAEMVSAQVDGLRKQGEGLQGERDGLNDGLGELQPDLILSEIGRLQRAISSSDEKKQEIEKVQYHLRKILEGEGAVGLNERLGDLISGLTSAREELASEERRASAMRLLFETAQCCREQMARQIMEPLRKKVEPLLGVVFDGVQFGFNVADTSGTLSLKPLVRSGVQDDFGRLSVGTQEQVGVAVRLGLAQVLAQKHDGRLPIFLDDPFVNADPYRHERVLAMLNYVRQDLQVILLTCDFDAYRALGLRAEQATEIGGDSIARLAAETTVGKAVPT